MATQIGSLAGRGGAAGGGRGGGGGGGGGGRAPRGGNGAGPHPPPPPRARAAGGAPVAFHASHSIEGAREAGEGVIGRGSPAIALQGDLTQIANARRAVDETVAAFGRLDILVNNAGVTRSVPFLETTEETYAE